MNKLKIEEKDLVSVAYMDLLLNNQNTPDDAVPMPLATDNGDPVLENNTS